MTSTFTATVLMSGGIDSAACVHHLRERGLVTEGLFIDYGQAAAMQESKVVSAMAVHLGIFLRKISVEGVGTLEAGELVGRNAFLIFTALFAVRGRPGLLGLGLHAGTRYYDCSEAFVEATSKLVAEHTDGKVSVIAPFLSWTKKRCLRLFYIGWFTHQRNLQLRGWNRANLRRVRILSRSEGFGMLARRRALRLNGQEIERTPLLVPSFSSKGFPNVAQIVDYSSELIDGVTLVSAYDIHYKKLKPSFDFPSLIFLDSGGYEASKDTELSDFGDKEHVPKPWSQAMHETQLAAWQPNVPSVLISYDHPKERVPIKAQIDRAKGMAPGRGGFLREILLKPEKAGQALLQMSDIIGNVHALADFDVIGVTEKEVGNSIFDRMKNIAYLRRSLDKAGLDIPIHVFGSLDTVTTPMYFLAGADIFDGLTWLRFAFHQGQTVYKHNYGALKFGVATKAHVINGRCWNDNYYYMKDMELEMRRYLNDNDITVFQYHKDLFRSALQSVIEAVGA